MPLSACARSRRSTAGCGSSRESRPPAPSARSRCAASPGRGDATIEGRAATDYERELRHKSVTPDYFKAMGIRLLAGRMFNDGDRIDQPRVAVVNEALAKKYFRGADPIGKRIKFARPVDNDAWVTIIGVVADEKQDGLDARPSLRPIRRSSSGCRTR